MFAIALYCCCSSSAFIILPFLDDSLIDSFFQTQKMPPRIWIPNANTLDKPMKHLTDTTRRKEALSLYREILRTAKHFHWADPVTGKPYNLLLKQQARQEFEASREETDPLILARMMITGRDCLQQVQQKFNDATLAAWKRIEQDTTRR